MRKKINTARHFKNLRQDFAGILLVSFILGAIGYNLGKKSAQTDYSSAADSASQTLGLATEKLSLAVDSIEPGDNHILSKGAIVYFSNSNQDAVTIAASYHELSSAFDQTIIIEEAVGFMQFSDTGMVSAQIYSEVDKSIVNVSFLVVD